MVFTLPLVGSRLICQLPEIGSDEDLLLPLLHALVNNDNASKNAILHCIHSNLFWCGPNALLHPNFLLQEASDRIRVQAPLTRFFDSNRTG